MGLEAPSPASLARIFRQEGVARAEPSKRPRAARRRFDLPRPQRLLAARRHRVRPGRRAQGGDLAGSRTTTGAWRWPGWSPRAMAGQAAIDVFDRGVAARGAHPAPARPTTARPRAPAGAQSPARPAGARALPGRRTPRRQSPCRPTTHGRQRALRPDPAPPPGPAAPGRLSRRAPGRRVDRFDHTLQHPAPPPRPARAHHRAAGPGRHRGRPGAPTGPRHRPHHPRRRTRARRARRAPTAAPAQAHRPQRRARSRPSPATGADHIGGIAFLVRRAPAGHRTTAIRDATTITFADAHGRHPDPVQLAARRRHPRLPPPARPHQPTRQAPAAGGPNRHRSPDTSNVTDVLIQNRHPCPETSHLFTLCYVPFSRTVKGQEA